MKIAILYKKILEGFFLPKHGTMQKLMPAKNHDKNKDVIKELEKTISPILVVNNSSLKPYVELFEYAPENIYQQPLGSLVGFFEVKEFSEESAYIVNFLTSVLKKEYYINPRRPITESLDSALHKVNIALSELAKHGNIEWLGKINAAICVIEKNSAHFSVSGDAKIFLYRGQNLSEISEGLASDSLEPHPLKTFVNVSSGRLEKNDRILITSADIFHILTAVEIKKNFQRFEGDKFVQFLKTALSNQMEMLASIIVEMTEVIEAPAAKTLPRKKSSKTANAFSEQTFANTLSSTTTLAKQEELDISIKSEADPEYTDEKTGHIYIQGEAAENIDGSHAKINLYWDIFKEKITQGSYLTKNELRKRFSLYKKQLAKKKELRRIENEKRKQLAAEENERQEKERVLQEMEHQQALAKQAELDRIQQEKENEIEKNRLAQEKIEQERLALKALATKKALESVIVTKQEPQEVQAQNPESSFLEKLRLARIEQQNNAVIDLRSKSVKPELERECKPALEDVQIIDEPETEIEFVKESSRSEKLKAFTFKIVGKISPLSENAIVFAKNGIAKFSAKKPALPTLPTMKLDYFNFNIIPHFSKIRKLFLRFSKKQKLYTLGALALIFIAPLFIVQFLNKPKPPTIAEMKVIPPTQLELLANEKNIRANVRVESVYESPEIVTALIANDNPTVITKTSVVVLLSGQPKEFSLPTGSGVPIRATFMKDLSLVIMITDSGKVISFSPISTKFADNKIDLANISLDSFIGTYLTYMYVLDQKTNQIYRYPRADGGFGEKTNWLKDSTSLAGVSDMTIDDNIYAIQNNQVLKFFKGKATPFALEASATPVNFDKICTTADLQNFYALDNKNSRVVQYSKEGSIIAQFYNEKIKAGLSLSIDEENKIAYVATSNGLISIELQ